LKSVSFVKGTPYFEKFENIPTVIVLVDFTDSAYSTLINQLFTKGSHHRNITLVLITQNVFHQVPSSRDISLNSKYILVLKTLETRLKLCTWPDRSTPKTFPVFTRRTWRHTYLFLEFKQSINIFFLDLEQRFL